VFATVTLPLALPGILAGMVLGFAKAIGEFGATITFVSNIPGRDADDFVGDLFADPDAGWRCRRDAARAHLDRHCDGRTDCVGMVRAARDTAAARELSMLRVDIKKQLGNSR
jgi:hypothetical protein